MVCNLAVGLIHRGISVHIKRCLKRVSFQVLRKNEPIFPFETLGQLGLVEGTNKSISKCVHTSSRTSGIKSWNACDVLDGTGLYKRTNSCPCIVLACCFTSESGINVEVREYKTKITHNLSYPSSKMTSYISLNSQFWRVNVVKQPLCMSCVSDTLQGSYRLCSWRKLIKTYFYENYLTNKYLF